MKRTFTDRPHVAVLDEELPFPLNSGKRIRTFNLLKRLAGSYRITYVCHQSVKPSEQPVAEAVMGEAGITPLVVSRQVPKKSGLGFHARLAANLFSPLPYSVASHRSPEMMEAVRRLNLQDPPDLWHCEWTPYAEYLRGPGCRSPWVVMAHNVESLIWQRYAEAEGNAAKRWYIRQQFRKFERFERWAYSTCDLPIAVSAEDARLMETRFGAPRTTVVDNGVDTRYFRPDESLTRDPNRILFLGSLDWRPNLDGVKLLLDEIFPAVRQKRPDAKLVLVGRKPAEWLRQRAAGTPGVELHGDVPDVRPFLASAGMLAVPLRIGGGSRLKILEALASSVPVITTTVGVEGLELDSHTHIAVADGPRAFAEGLVKVMSDHPAAVAQAGRGRERVAERYDWDGLARRLDDCWSTVIGARKPKTTAAAGSSV